MTLVFRRPHFNISLWCIAIALTMPDFLPLLYRCVDGCFRHIAQGTFPLPPLFVPSHIVPILV
jgi:hypothetical protein